VLRAVSACLVAVALLLSSQTARAENPVVRFATTEGVFDVELCEELSTLCLGVAPGTVTNFLNYVDRGDYQDSLIHRSVPYFVIQGGGFLLDTDDVIRAIPADPPVTNTFNQSNKRGTVAMARMGGQVNSATNQWYVNLADNGGTAPDGLDFIIEGFTVFGVVTGDGMTVLDWISERTLRNLYNNPNFPETFFDPIFDPDGISSAFTTVPLNSDFVGPLTLPTDVVPYLITMDITRVPESDAALQAVAACIVLAAVSARRAG
jgi:peptidyl-prolyl cis-trans isomerase A (cyclophilin A)